MRFAKLITALFLSFAVASATAGTVKVPAKNPLVTVIVPDSWKPEKMDRGVAFESPDDVVTMLFEVAASEKAMGGIVDGNIDWLVKEQGVKIDGASKKDGEMVVGGISSSSMMYDANHKEYGPASVGFIFTPINGKLLIITFWLNKKGFKKHEATLDKILESVKPAK